MSANYDLSRMWDRVREIREDIESVAHSKVDTREDPELRKLSGQVLSSLDALQFAIEDRLGHVENYEAVDV